VEIIQDAAPRVADPRPSVTARALAAQHGMDPDASTRQRVSQSILEHGPSTAAALAERLGLTAAAVRRHLDVLLERGHLVARDQRVYGSRGRGRPAKVFVLSDAGRAAFYSAYDDIAIQALEFLSEQAGPDAVTRFAASRAAAVEQRYADSLAAADPEVTPAQALAGALTGDGYVASVQPSALGEQLCQHHCPVAHVAERFPQLCEVETELFSRVLGVHVQRLATIAHGDGVCTTHIPRASGTTHIPRASGTTHIPRAAGVPHLTPAGGSVPPAQPNNPVSPDAVPGVAPPATYETPEPLGIPRERPLS
jgi:predicted ArsR family transcriptional regulator